MAKDAIIAKIKKVFSCKHRNWRFLDCEECLECHLKICVDCGANLNEL
jgi:hypothetical protein